MSGHNTYMDCPHGKRVPPFQARILAGEDVTAPQGWPTDLCHDCFQAAEPAERRVAAAYHAQYGAWEGTLLRGRVQNVVFTPDLGKFVVLFSPFGFATVAPENADAFTRHGKTLGQRVGEFWEIGFAEDGDIWFSRIVQPTHAERLAELWQRLKSRLHQYRTRKLRAQEDDLVASVYFSPDYPPPA